MENKTVSRVQMLVESAVMLAIATVLSMIKLFNLPYGGSVTIASMLPIIIISYRHGLRWGLLSGLVYGIIQQLLGLDTLSWVTTWQSIVAVILLDYIIAFAVTGFGGVFRKKCSQPMALLLGALLVGLLRYICHVISGATVWAGLSIPTNAAMIYSLGYNATYMIPETITHIVTFLGVLIILLTINSTLALITCAPIPFIFASGIVFSKKVRPYFRASQKKMGELNGKLQDNLSGIHEIQSFGREEYETERVNEKNFQHIHAMLKALKISAVFHPSVEFISSIGTVLVVGFGGLLAYRGQLSVEDIVAFMLYLGLFYAPVTGLANLLENMQQSMAGAERVLAVLDAPCEIVDRPGAKRLEHVTGDITFDHVSFSYDNRVPVLNDVSFHCAPGKMLALVGPTGVGKTTLTQLISRFYEPTSGRILIDGTDLNDITLESLRQNISPVLQDTFLFNGTIAENIGMPEGYSTQVGERGLRLSGGQKQRVAIARAILRRSPIIILDEATAAVDVETERQIQEAIAGLAGQKTIIAIAHRLSTIRNADLILVIEDGKVKEQGTHDELVALGGSYARMNRIQNTTGSQKGIA